MKHIVISKALHALLKKYCLERGLVMQVLVAEIVKDFLDIDDGPGPFRVSDPRVIASQDEKNRTRSRIVDKASRRT